MSKKLFGKSQPRRGGMFVAGRRRIEGGTRMAHKELLFDEDARRALERGVNIVADAVKVTRTALASTLTPLSIAARASSLNFKSFAATFILLYEPNDSDGRDACPR